jgi:hypothetical protein
MDRARHAEDRIIRRLAAEARITTALEAAGSRPGGPGRLHAPARTGFVARWQGRLVNIHPSLLPAYPGTEAIRRAWEAGEPLLGVTVHYVDEGMDTGPVLARAEVARQASLDATGAGHPRGRAPAVCPGGCGLAGWAWIGAEPHKCRMVYLTTVLRVLSAISRQVDDPDGCTAVPGSAQGGSHMKVLILGNGAREHALAWSFSRSKRNSGLFCMPGNAGTADIAVNIDGDYCDGPSVVDAARKHGVNMVVIGPEAALAAGVADAVRAAGIAAFGPGASAARLESSKAFARDFSNRAGIPSARTLRFTKLADFVAWLDAGRPGPAAGAATGANHRRRWQRSQNQGLFGLGRPCLGSPPRAFPLLGGALNGRR